MPLTEEQKRKSRKWYDSFLIKLENEGITYSNPLSLGFIKILDDSRFGEYCELNEDYDFDNTVKSLKIAAASNRMAFMKENENHPYFSNDEKGINQNYVEHLYSNMKDPNSLTDEEVYELYNEASNGKLIIETRSALKDDLISFNHILIDNNGEAKITKGLGEFQLNNRLNRLDKDKDAPYTEEEKAILEGQGYTEEEFKKVERQFESSAQMSVALASNALTDSIDNNGAKEKTFEEVREAFEEIRFPHVEHKLLCLAYANPGLFETEKSRLKINETIKAYGVSGMTADEKENKIIQDNPIFLDSMVDLGRRIKKEAKINPSAILPKNVVTDYKGKEIENLNTYEGMNNFAKFCVTEGSPFKINGKPVIYSRAMKTIFKAAPAQEYASEVEEVLNELKSTNTNLTSNSPEYEALLKGLKDFTNNFKKKDGDQVKFEFSSLQSEITTLSNLAREYRRSHENGPFKPRNLRRLAAMAKLERIEEAAKKKDMDPGNKIKKIAEKITLGSAVSMALSKDPKYVNKGFDILFNKDSIIHKEINLLGKSKEFEFMMTGNDGKLLPKDKIEKMAFVSNEKAFDMLGDSIDRQEEMAKKKQNEKAIEKADIEKDMEVSQLSN